MKPYFDQAYRKYRGQAEIKGFRRGKAPLDMVKRMYGSIIEQETLRDVASESFNKAMVEKMLSPLGDPVITDMNYQQTGDFHFKVKFEILPQIVLKSYKGLEFKKYIHTIGDSDVDEELLRLRKSRSEKQDIQTVSGTDDIVTVDWLPFTPEGEPIAEEMDRNVQFDLSEESLDPEIKHALKAAEVGKEYDVKLLLDTNDGEKKQHPIRLIVRKITKLLLPEIDETFVKNITNNTITDTSLFKGWLREQMQHSVNDRSQRRLMNDLIGEIVKLHDFDLPETLIQKAEENRLKQLRELYPNKQLPADFDYHRFELEYRPDAIFNLKWFMLRNEIIKAENLKAEAADYETIAEQQSVRTGIDKDKLITYYKSSDKFTDQIIEDKLSALLLKNNNITEVPLKEK
jgi:trigger factor